MKSLTTWFEHCNEKLELIDYSVAPKADDGCYFVCPKCSAWNPLINASASMTNEFESTWLVQPNTVDADWGSR